MMQRGDSADHEDPSAEREEGQRWGFRFTLAGFENATIVATSGEIAQVGVGKNAGGRINEHVGFVVTGSELQLSFIEPATDDVGFGRHIDASRGLDRMSAHRLCLNAKGFRDERASAASGSTIGAASRRALCVNRTTDVAAAATATTTRRNSSSPASDNGTMREY